MQQTLEYYNKKINTTMIPALTSGMTKTIGLLACLLMIIHPSLQQEDAATYNNVKQSLFRQRRKVIEVDSLNPHKHQHDTLTMYNDVEHNHSPIRRMRTVNVEPKMISTTNTDEKNKNNHIDHYNKLLSTKEVASQFVFDRLLEDLFSPASSLSFSFSMCMSMSMSMSM